MAVAKNDAGTPAINRAFTQRGILTTPGTETGTETLKVIDPNTGQTFIEGTDYVVVRLTVGEDVEIATRDDLYTICRVIDGGHIDPGDVVQVSYRLHRSEYHRSTPCTTTMTFATSTANRSTRRATSSPS